VSAEDGADYDDLKPLTRRLMARMEEDIGTSLDWVAVDHFNTGHPHTHIVVRGKDERGKDLIIARDYIAHGLRERAAELVDLDLGPRTDDDIARRLRAEIEQERLTSIDRALLREADADILVSSAARGAFDQPVRTGRLRKLERLGLAAQHGALHWRLSPDLETVLRKMGERGDIIRMMQRAYAARGDAPAASEQVIYEPVVGAAPIVGRVVERGLADEHHDRHYLIVEATDGRSHFVDIGRATEDEPYAPGAIVRVVPVEAEVRDADRAIVAVAAANDGLYSLDAHLRHDPSARQAFAEAHVRRLEAMRRLSLNVERRPDGTWIISADHLERAATHERTAARDRPVAVETLSPVSLDRLARAEAATWLDRELVADDPVPLRDAGFGREARAALTSRRQWLVAEGLATERGEGAAYRRDMLAVLRRRELIRVAALLASEMGKSFAEAAVGERIEGRLARRLELLSGRYAVIERSRDFTLVPWRPILDRNIGKPVAGIMREGRVNWTLGRDRPSPTIS
jgi:type IV secretory pathway VirD2 relaxase